MEDLNVNGLSCVGRRGVLSLIVARILSGRPRKTFCSDIRSATAPVFLEKLILRSAASGGRTRRRGWGYRGHVTKGRAQKCPL